MSDGTAPRPGRRVEILERRRVYDAFFKLDVLELRHERFDAAKPDHVAGIELIELRQQDSRLQFRQGTDDVATQQVRAARLTKDGGATVYQRYEGSKS